MFQKIKTKIKNIFQIPYLEFYFSKPFGLDISDYSIEIVSLEGLKDNPKLLALGREILPPGVIEEGRILNKENLEVALKNLISNPQFEKIKTRKLIFSLPESKSFICTFELPKALKKTEISEFIKSQITQTFPFPLDELYFDFQLKENQVLLVAAQKEIIDDYLDVFKTCKLQAVALENESMSWNRALIKEKEKVILIVDIGAKTTNLVLFDDKELKLSFSIEIAGNKFTKVISEKLNIPFKKAEEIKKKIGLNPEMEGGKIFLILQKEILEIIEEIRKIENYFLGKTGKKIEKIILIGGSALLPYLADYLSENLEKKVEIGDPLSKINIDILEEKGFLKETLKTNSVLYSTAFGLALRGLERNPQKEGINLIKELNF
jgi:type IV pilus assembly protein PilM